MGISQDINKMLDEALKDSDIGRKALQGRAVIPPGARGAEAFTIPATEALIAAVRMLASECERLAAQLAAVIGDR